MKESFCIKSAYQNNTPLRRSLSALAEKTFGFSLEPFYEMKAWNEKYIPFSIVRDGSVAANVSINRVSMLARAHQYHPIQIGTVMTDPAFQKRGYARTLLEHVLETTCADASFIFLFANEHVLSFYPKFGFTEREEHEVVFRAEDLLSSHYSCRPLNPDCAGDLSRLRRAMIAAQPVSPVVSVQDNVSLIRFYTEYTMRGNCVWLEPLNAVALVEREGDTVFLLDILSRSSINPEEAAACVCKDAAEVVLGFMPDLNALSIPYTLRKHDDHLFVRGNFPLDEPFLIPFLARA